MARTQFDKLIRDLIPAIIEKDGHTCAIEPMSDTEFQPALREKLVEEAKEAATAPAEKLAAELADVQEVIEALMALHGLTSESVMEVQRARRLERGGFARRLRLLWTE
jgi:predicted house-cleaning noncanonical NTP pyrophosphatase (MazG superfamily)